MERFQTVNGGKDTMHPFGASDLLKPPPEVVEAVERARVGGRGRAPGGVVSARADRPGTAEVVNHGPCLYFGPQGQRCEKRATATGFCARHSAAHVARNSKFWDASAQPEVVEEPNDEADVQASTDANPASVRKRVKLMALLGLVGVLWPVLHELLRALISFLHDK